MDKFANIPAGVQAGTAVAAAGKPADKLASAFRKKMAKAAAMISQAMLFLSLLPMRVYASTLDVNKYSINGDLSDFNVEGLVIGIMIWGCRIAGVAVAGYSIYGLIVADKDGDASRITTPIFKLVGGGVLIGLPTILKTIGLISY